MRYMLLIYSSERTDAQTPPEERQAIMDGHRAVMEGTTKAGILRGAEPLHPTSTATTVRIQNGQPVTTDGPFAETKEQLAGYYILDCKDLDEAISWAPRFPPLARVARDVSRFGLSWTFRRRQDAVRQAVAQAL